MIVDYGDNRIIRPRGDPFSILTGFQKQVEVVIRVLLPDGVNIRSNSVYTWADEELARRLWPLSWKKYLYELEIKNS